MAEIWSKKKDVERLAEYSMWDSELTIKLANLILPQIFALARFTGQLPFDICRYTYSQLVEGFFMHKAFTDDVLIPNRPKTEEIEERRMKPAYKGAAVIEPKKGIHSDVLVFDFRSLYPTIIVTHNIDPWTFNFKGCKKKYEVPEHKGGWYFCADAKGFIPKHLEEVIKRRQEIKHMMKQEKNPDEHTRLDNEQFALKTIANATYGYLAYFGARWYRLECGAAAAAWGRYYIGKVIEEAKQQSFEIIYGDTDSLMIIHPELKGQQKLFGMGEKFAESVNDKLPGIIELEFRNLYKGGIFVARMKDRESGAGAKKRYALVDYEGNLEIRGFETVRRDWCELSKRIQREVLVMILRDRDPAKAVRTVRDTIEKIKGGEVCLDDLAIFEQITRPLAAYQSIGPHVKAAMKALQRGRPVGEGTVIAFVITKGKGSISDRAEPLEDVKPGQYDPDYYINNQVLPAAMRVLKALGYEEKEILSGKIQKKLEAWIKK
jgi:DNA polymerase Pol2